MSTETPHPHVPHRAANTRSHGPLAWSSLFIGLFCWLWYLLAPGPLTLDWRETELWRWATLGGAAAIGIGMALAAIRRRARLSLAAFLALLLHAGMLALAVIEIVTIGGLARG